MAKAEWNGEVIAESDKGILTEGNIYFPPDSVKQEFFKKSSTRYDCPWKGHAGYYDIVVKGKVNKDAAWYYFDTYPVANRLRNFVAFDRSKGIEIIGKAASRLDPPN